MMKQQTNAFLIVTLIIISITILTITNSNKINHPKPLDRELITKTGVCPPFHLYDEDGNLIDPINGINADKPYSTKQTCGKCHDYDLITEGYHFQQGKDEQPSEILANRYQWVSHPGNYGGNWCSPAPLYNYLSNKHNSSEKEMDMTSFTFITNGCGSCHPGGGPLEFDRNGNRYDTHMRFLGYETGGNNDYDGDYYHAYWNRSGVIEADCNICHQTDYDYDLRNSHLRNWNFRWMATAGAKIAKINGALRENQNVTVEYDISKFDKDGKISMQLVRHPRNENCLNCHAKPQWKKRGTNFTKYTDVHIAKGLRCVDCHAAGSMAVDERIRGKEVHQFGKGDDPSGHVRNDLNNTMRTCADCHIDGYLNAPIAKHEWLPDLHFDKLSCQTCHIPQRAVKSALAQMSDVYNPGTKIRPPAKYIWTFYDPNLNYWNHYGELDMMGFEDKPTDYFIPQFANYKGLIFPVNAVHSAWPGIYTPGEKGLHQPRMQDIYNMWKAHFADNSIYPELALIRDDNRDSIPEVNRPEEIDAFINSVTSHLISIGYDMGIRKVVWVNNDRMYFNSQEYEVLDKEIYESSPYASVYKYSHDVFPANAALGSTGCTDCHSTNSNIFFGNVVKYPFDSDGNTVYESQYVRLNLSGFAVWTSAIREQYIKSLQNILFIFLAIVLILSVLLNSNKRTSYFKFVSKNFLWFYTILVAIISFVYLKADISAYLFPDRLWFDKQHFYLTFFAIAVGLYSLANMRQGTSISTIFKSLQYTFLAAAFLSGFLLLIKFDGIEELVRYAYTIYDISVFGSMIISVYCLISWQYSNAISRIE